MNLKKYICDDVFGIIKGYENNWRLNFNDCVREVGCVIPIREKSYTEQDPYFCGWLFFDKKKSAWLVYGEFFKRKGLDFSSIKNLLDNNPRLRILSGTYIIVERYVH